MAPYAFPNIHPAYHPQRQSHSHHHPPQHQHHPQHHHPQHHQRPPAAAPPPRQAAPPPPPTHRRAHSSPPGPGVASFYRLYTVPPHHPRAAAPPPPWSPDPGPGGVYIPVVPSPAEVAMARRMQAAGEQMRRADAARAAGAIAAMTPRSHAPPPGMGIYGWAGCGCPLVEGFVPRRGVPGRGAGMLPWAGARGQQQQQGERYLRGTYDGVPERRRRTSAPPPRLAFRRTPTPVARPRASRAHFATARQHWIGGEGEGGYLTASETEVTTEDDDSLATWEVYGGGEYDGVPYYEDEPEEEEEDDESLGWDFMNGDYVRPEVVYRSFCGCCPE